MQTLNSTARACALTLMVCAGALEAETVVTRAARLEGEVARVDSQAVVLRQGGWTVTVPAADALAVIDSGSVRWLAAEAAEDAALRLAARGRDAEALAAYRRALRATLADLWSEQGYTPPAAS